VIRGNLAGALLMLAAYIATGAAIALVLSYLH
jgi:hypothetical protein